MKKVSVHNPQIKAFFDYIGEFQDLTPDDVTLHPFATKVRASDVDLGTRFTEGISLRSPFISAAMDTVTMADMAIAQAKGGNIGVLHGGLSAEEQKKEARRVKLHLNGRIEDPVCAFEDQTIKSLLDECANKNYDFRTFPVIDKHGKLRGIITKHNLRFWERDDQLVGELMVKKSGVQHANENMDIAGAYDTMLAKQLNTLPLIDKAGTVRGLYIWSDVKRIHEGNPDDYALDDQGHLRVAAAVRTRPEQALEYVLTSQDYVDVFVIDSSHGHSQDTLDTLTYLRKKCGPKLQIVAGNVVDKTSALRLAAAGASAIKVGIGGGAICTTREVTGSGKGQLTAVYQVVRALREHGFDIPVISDGGTRTPGDAAKLLAVGAESVMMGQAFAGTDEAPGKIITNASGATVKEYRGMGSIAAQTATSAARGYTSGSSDGKLFSEGVVAQVEYKGPVSRIIFDFQSGVRNAMANADARTISEFHRNAQLGRLTSAGAAEGSPHIGRSGQIISN